MVGMFWQEVEMGGAGDLVEGVVLPDAVFEFDDGVAGQQGDSGVNLHFHHVLYPDEQLAVLAFVLLAQSLGD